MLDLVTVPLVAHPMHYLGLLEDTIIETGFLPKPSHPSHGSSNSQGSLTVQVSLQIQVHGDER